MFRYMMFYSSFSSWISQFLACVGSCLGCCVNSQTIIAVNDPAKGLNQMVKKPCLSEDFWSTSTCDLDNSTLQSQRSFSSISTSNLILSQFSGTCSTSSHSEFVNHGLLLWNQSRLQWLGTKKPQSHGKAHQPVLSWNASYDNLLITSKRFPQAVPLSEMVDLLVDIWDQEGLYD